MKDAVIVDNLSFKYTDGKDLALKGINLSIKEGEFVGIVGPNSAGKSSLCRLFNGLIPHSFTGDITGDVYIKGMNTKELKTSQLAQHVGFVFSDPEAQLSQMTVWEEIAFGQANSNPKNANAPWASNIPTKTA